MTNGTGSKFLSRLLTVAFSGAGFLLLVAFLMTGDAPLFAEAPN